MDYAQLHAQIRNAIEAYHLTTGHCIERVETTWLVKFDRLAKARPGLASIRIVASLGAVEHDARAAAKAEASSP